MDINPREHSAPPTADQVESLTECLREDLFELVDGLFPLDIVDHVARAVVLLDSFARISPLGISTLPR